ncbi:MAG: SH3 domain-containing protein [Saprospiraceae bacterium]
MAFKKLPKLEFILIGVFFIGFVLWAVPKCSATKKELNPEEEIGMQDTVKVDSTATPQDGVTVVEENSAAQEAKPIPVATGNADYSRLYITINKLKLRKGPDLESEVVAQLGLFEEVYFLNEVTDFKTELNLGLETATEPWIKIRTKTGQEGWVFGAGVNYYKKKREGVLE